MIKGFLKTLREQTGFSLTEVMVGAGLLAGVGLLGAQLFKGQKVAQRSVDNDRKLANYHQYLTKLLSKPEHCNATIKSFMASPSSIANNQVVTSIQSCSSNCTDTNAVGNLSHDAFTTGQFVPAALITPGASAWIDGTASWAMTNAVILTGAGPKTTSGAVILRINYKLNSKIGTKAVSKDILLNLRFAAGVFRECLSHTESNINNLQNDLCKTLYMDDGTGVTTTGQGVVATWNDVNQVCDVNWVKDCTGPNLAVDGMDAAGVIKCQPLIKNNSTNNWQSPTLPTNTNCQAPQKPHMKWNGNQMQMYCN